MAALTNERALPDAEPCPMCGQRHRVQVGRSNMSRRCWRRFVHRHKLARRPELSWSRR